LTHIFAITIGRTTATTPLFGAITKHSATKLFSFSIAAILALLWLSSAALGLRSNERVKKALKMQTSDNENNRFAVSLAGSALARTINFHFK
jgi:hypothetical protein